MNQNDSQRQKKERIPAPVWIYALLFVLALTVAAASAAELFGDHDSLKKVIICYVVIAFGYAINCIYHLVHWRLEQRRLKSRLDSQNSDERLITRRRVVIVVLLVALRALGRSDPPEHPNRPDAGPIP
jgi:hypothetical protein